MIIKLLIFLAFVFIIIVGIVIDLFYEFREYEKRIDREHDVDNIGKNS